MHAGKPNSLTMLRVIHLAFKNYGVICIQHHMYNMHSLKYTMHACMYYKQQSWLLYITGHVKVVLHHH